MLRVAVLVLGCAGCVATVRDLPPDRGFAESPALLAGRWRVTGTRIGSTILLQTGDEQILLRPDQPTFLVAVPPATYVVRRFGSFAPSNTRVTLEARPGATIYIGTFEAGALRAGELRIEVVDEMDDVEEDLRRRYGDKLPGLTRGLVRLSPGPADGSLVITVVPTWDSYTYPRYRYGFQYGGHRH